VIVNIKYYIIEISRINNKLSDQHIKLNEYMNEFLYEWILWGLFICVMGVLMFLIVLKDLMSQFTSSLLYLTRIQILSSSSPYITNWYTLLLQKSRVITMLYYSTILYLLIQREKFSFNIYFALLHVLLRDYLPSC